MQNHCTSLFPSLFALVFILLSQVEDTPLLPYSSYVPKPRRNPLLACIQYIRHWSHYSLPFPSSSLCCVCCFFAGGGVGQQRLARELALRMLFDSRYIANLPARVTFDLHGDAGDLGNEVAFINDNQGTYRQANARFSVGKALLDGPLCVQTLWRVKQVTIRVSCWQKPSHPLVFQAGAQWGPCLQPHPMWSTF